MIPAAGYVYVVGFDNADVKVGRTQNFRRRLSKHRSNARKAGLTITDSWVSPLHLAWDVNEETLKVLAAKSGGTAKSWEYFSNADYAAIVSAATRLPFTSPDEGAGGGAACLRHPRSARECAGRVAAIDAMERETADTAREATWERLKAGTTCANCQAA